MTEYIIKINEEDMKKAEEVFEGLGMSFETGLNVYIKKVVGEREVPYRIKKEIEQADPNARKEAFDKFMSMYGILKGYDIDLDKEREERILGR
ncbi:MAG: hypothetical protein LBS19_02865 [Clostridiales bacterium]|nr:hypothetical protein [Clostridiales bacterium]